MTIVAYCGGLREFRESVDWSLQWNPNEELAEEFAEFNMQSDSIEVTAFRKLCKRSKVP